MVPHENRLRPNSKLSSNSASHNSDTIYYLIWLDIDANNDELTRNELNSFKTCQLKTFDNVRTCEQYVFSNPNARFIFIVSYKLGFIITPMIASLKQTVTIIVYSKNNIEKTHGSWIDQYLTVHIACKFFVKQDKFVFLVLESSTSCDRLSKTKICSPLRTS